MVAMKRCSRDNRVELVVRNMLADRIRQLEQSNRDMRRFVAMLIQQDDGRLQVDRLAFTEIDPDPIIDVSYDVKTDRYILQLAPKI